MKRKDAIKVLHSFKSDYDFAYNRVNELDKYTQDLLHKLELNKLSQSDKNKIATELRHVRQDRRYYKDVVDVYQPLVDVNSEYKNSVFKVANAISSTMSKYENLNKRLYRPKIKEIIKN